VNVSKFGRKLAGAGGFINISQTARKIVFVGTFTANGLEVSIKEGELKVENEGSVAKLVPEVEQITFNAKFALENEQQVLYVTERCVFELTDVGIELIEVAPGVDLQTDILDQLPFEPIVNDPAPMDARIFNDAPMALVQRDELTTRRRAKQTENLKPRAA